MRDILDREERVVCSSPNYDYTIQIKTIKPELFVNTETIARADSLGKYETNDCVVKAFMAALNITYKQSHAWVEKYLKRKPRKGTFTVRELGNIIGIWKNHYNITLKGFGQYYATCSRMYQLKQSLKLPMNANLKWLYNPKYKKPTDYTLKTFMEQHPTGRFVVLLKGHAVAVVEGKLHANPNEKNYGFCRRVLCVIECK